MNVYQGKTIVILMLSATISKGHLTALAKKDIEEMVLTAQVHNKIIL